MFIGLKCLRTSFIVKKTHLNIGKLSLCQWDWLRVITRKGVSSILAIELCYYKGLIPLDEFHVGLVV